MHLIKRFFSYPKSYVLVNYYVIYKLVSRWAIMLLLMRAKLRRYWMNQRTDEPSQSQQLVAQYSMGFEQIFL